MLPDELNTLVANPLDNRTTVIARAVIDDDQFPVPNGLQLNRSYCSFDGRGAVPH